MCHMMLFTILCFVVHGFDLQYCLFIFLNIYTYVNMLHRRYMYICFFIDAHTEVNSLPCLSTPPEVVDTWVG